MKKERSTAELTLSGIALGDMEEGWRTIVSWGEG